ncbi:MAG: MBL fold metallo-hydrolase [Spirochaetota bacterium]
MGRENEMKKQAPRGRKLPLTNSGALSLFPVGCGSAFTKRLYQNNFLIVKGNDHLMIDCGTRTPEALAKLGRSVTEIDTWLITHSHADHIGGLEEVVLTGRYVARRKPSVIITPEYEAILWEHSLKGGSAFNEVHGGENLGFADFWNVIRPTPLHEYPRDTHEVNVGSINIKMVRTRHYPEQARDWTESAYSVGLIVDDRIFFTGDTQFDPDLLTGYDAVFNFDYIFHDVQFFTGGVHAGLDELCTLPDSLKSRIVLMHYPDNFQRYRKRITREGFAGFAQQGRFHVF